MNILLSLVLIAELGAGAPGVAITVEDDIPGYIAKVSILDATLLPCHDGTRPAFATNGDRGFAIYCDSIDWWPTPNGPLCPISAHWTTVPGGWQVHIRCEGTPVS